MAKLRWKLRQPHPAGTLILGEGENAIKIEVDEHGCFETNGRPDFPLYTIAKRFPYRLDDLGY